ncbi:MAG: 16S rRNA (adenine(1518)-N(6)/adenine(1519)-N(6))-dimethyltransferase RsmA [Chlamydiales bacterium]|nr:16S rRNA (adenine(1518)-N(6)/adenine(1519)-N(6))-dimethyltransferase RsmA [Chlamydiales bacterium]
MYRPSELLLFLESIGTHPKKSLSQNFLIDGNIIRKIVETAQVVPGDLVVEIGPGPGALTEALLQAGAHVIAIEKDTVLAGALQRFSKAENSLTVITEDVLKVRLEDHIPPGKKAKVIANLPYHITTPILTGLAPKHDMLQSITVMVQKEVAERMTAPAGNHVYGSLTVFLAFYADVKYAFTVTRNCFLPPPKVDSAVVHLDVRKGKSVSDEDKFFKLTRSAFEQRRKMLRSSLRDLYTPEAVTKALEGLKLNPLARPEELSIDHFIRLFEALQ